MSDPKDYTIGWICAICTERVAAEAFLDEEYDPPDHVSPHDNNDYTLGRMGRHNVVIAVLPDGEYGESSAAGVARDMLHSFPNVKVGLMVGIGGGAPSRRHDIRLGDIAVSSSCNGLPSVLQYDFGKRKQGQEFKITGLLNQPPTILRTAVNGLKAQYEGNGHTIREAIQDVINKKPRLRKKYKRPEKRQDRLYHSNIVHPVGDNVVCALNCGDDQHSLKARPDRTDEDDDPAIHYGTIASANKLMKDAIIRDRLAVEKNVVCFEMEAAGLMNHFPCLIIRGICDYSDSHKSEEWRGYAAMAAAANSKDLLARIPPSRVRDDEEITELISRAMDTIAQTNKHVQTLTASLGKNEHTEILNWLTLHDYGPRHSDVFKSRKLGTGLWLLDSKEYRTWKTSSNSTLICPGIPGAGKTVLASIIIDDITQSLRSDISGGLAYIYLEDKRRPQQTIEHLSASLLKQLCEANRSLPECLKNSYEQHQKQRTRPSLEDLQQSLHAVAASFESIYIVIGALDECERSGGCLNAFLSEIFDLQRKTDARILITCRHIPDILSMLKKYPSLNIRAQDTDLQIYLNSRLPELPEFIRGHPSLWKEIQEDILRGVDGMFLLAKFYLNSLAEKINIASVRKLLSEIGSGSNIYDTAYEDIMSRIRGQVEEHKNLAEKALIWIIYARRQLLITEIKEALAIELGATSLDKESITDVDLIVSVCAGLVVIDAQSNIIRLVHHTTQEYFNRTRSDWFKNAEDMIARTCISYLSFDVFEIGSCKSPDDYTALLLSNSLYKYAAQNWGHHVAGTVGLDETVMQFLNQEGKVEATSYILIYEEQSWYFPPWRPKITAMHLAGYFGLCQAIDALVQRGIDPNLKDALGRPALWYSAANGNDNAIKRFLAAGAKVNENPDPRPTALYKAVEGCHIKAVNALIAAGASVEVQTECSDNVLHIAAKTGCLEIVEMLLQAGAKVNTSFSGETVLHTAARWGYLEIVDTLLKAGAKVNAGCDGESVLHTAAREGYLEIVDKLLKAGAKVNASFDGETALHAAAGEGYPKVVDALLDAGADFNASHYSGGYCGITPLHLAIEKGHLEIVERLIVAGAFNTVTEDNKRRMWLAAAQSGHAKIIHRLYSAELLR